MQTVSNTTMIHPLVRDLYKRVLIVGKDYPNTDYGRVKQIWKAALRNPSNCPSWYTNSGTSNDNQNDVEELYHAVHRGRHMIKEMIGIIQLHKYRTMKKRYPNDKQVDEEVQNRMNQLLKQQ
jgi:hypothetical protein